MKKRLLILLSAILVSCGPTKFEKENVKYSVESDGKTEYVVGEIKKLPGGCISYSYNCGCFGDATKTTTVCGTYKITQIR